MYSGTQSTCLRLLPRIIGGHKYDEISNLDNLGDCLSTSNTTHHELTKVETRRSALDSDRPPSSIINAYDFEKAKYGNNQPVTWLSLPNKRQLFILALCRLSEPLSSTCLLPYLYYLIRSLQSPDSSSSGSISRQAGLLVSLFALSQFATSMPWAYIANRYGRKPSILTGLILSVVANLGFGFSTSVPAVMCWRVVAGVGNGNIGVMRTMTAEIVVEKKYQSRAFLLLPLIFNSGVVIGLALGGCLADPVVNLSWLFGPQGLLNLGHNSSGVAWLQKYPYALPTIFNAGVLSCSLLLAICGLKETMPKKGGKDYGLVVGRMLRRLVTWIIFGTRTAGYVAVEPDDVDCCEGEKLGQDIPNTPVPTGSDPTKAHHSPGFTRSAKSTWTRAVVTNLISFALLPLHNAAFMQVFPVFLSTPRSTSPSSFVFFNGGLGLPSSTIGLFLSSFGVFGILIQLLVYPRLQATLGTLWTYRLALSIFPLAYILAPYLDFISSHVILRSFGLAFILLLQVTARTFAIPSAVILLTNSTSTPTALGMIHGAGNMLSSLSRAAGPLFGGQVLAWGVERGFVGAVWWLYLTVIASIGFIWSWTLEEGDGLSQRPTKEGTVELELVSK